MFLPIDPNTGLPDEASFEDFETVWKAVRDWMFRRRAAKLGRKLHRLSDAQLRELGLARLLGFPNKTEPAQTSHPGEKPGAISARRPLRGLMNSGFSPE
jgi:uncharacterized protein YjiS (DUF1127 family)